jgi:aminoglycoside phosphotransferase (APT) family kinase protein
MGQNGEGPSAMHATEVATDVHLVRRLLVEQFPEWSALAISRVDSAGTDNALYRLGEDMVVRLPRVSWAREQIDKEQRFLPRLAHALPLDVPLPLGKGHAGGGYPWEWGVYRWLDGETATLDRVRDFDDFALELARFITTLHGLDATAAPAAGEHNSHRGVPLALRDAPTRAAIASLADELDSARATTVWENALAAPAWSAAPVWVHGDLQSGNLLARDGRLGAVIDFGCLGAGDPAVDLIVAWNLLPDRARAVFRSALAMDEATWERGRGWALSTSVVALAYYRNTNPALSAIARRALAQLLGEEAMNARA